MRSVFSLILMLPILLCYSIAVAAPDLQVVQPTFDFGEVFQGDKVLHVFEFVNQGDEALMIDRVNSSCGCTAVLVSEKNVPPGSKGELQANFDTTRFHGKVSKTIYLYSNDPVRPVMQLHIQGKVLQTVAIDPAQVNLGQVKTKELVTASVVLRNQGGKPLTLSTPQTTATELKAKLSKKSFAPGETVTLELQLTAKPGQDRFSGYVLIPVEGVPKNELRIPVYAKISG
jgi:hypothetical protein